MSDPRSALLGRLARGGRRAGAVPAEASVDADVDAAVHEHGGPVEAPPGLPAAEVDAAYARATAPGTPWHAPAQWGVGTHPLREDGGLSTDLRAQRLGGPDARGAARARRRALLAVDRLDLPALAAALEAETAAVVVGGLAGATGPRRARPSEAGGRVLVVDVRCLQSGEYDTRGVGKHALSVLRTLAGTARGAALPYEVVGLVDPEAGDLAAAAAALLDRSVVHAADLPRGDVRAFVSLSPMTHDSAVVAPFLLPAGLRTAAVVYDLVPYRAPWRYLTDETARTVYEARLLALHGYDRLLPISRATAEDLVALGGLPAGRSLVTGVADPLGAPGPAGGAEGPGAEGPGAGVTGGAYVLAPTGADPRKDLPCAVAAYAAARSRGAGPGRLVVVGRLSVEQQDAARDLAAGLGVAPDEVDLRSGVVDADLAALYAGASAVLVTSVAEGFSLPLAEAVRRGTPVVASDIAPHRELLGDGAWLARRRDPVATAEALLTVLADRSGVLAAQEHALGDLAAPEAVGARLADAARWLLPEGPTAPDDGAPQGPGRPRVALVTPWRPQVSGISDFSAATVEALVDLADVTVHSDAEDPVAGPAPVLPLTVEPYLDPAVDAVVSVLGNSLLHLPVLQAVRTFGGPVLAHDSRLFEVYLASRGAEATARLVGAPGRPLDAEQFHRALLEPDLLPRLGFAEVSPHARPLVVHSEPLARRLADEGPTEPVVLPFVPYTVPAGAVDEQRVRAARERLGLGPEVVVASFGLVDVRTKGADRLVAAARWCEAWGADLVLHLVGPVADAERSQLTGMARRLGLSRAPVLHGHVPREELQTWLLAADVAVQLRRLRLGVSGALADCVAHGVPTVATAGIAEELDAPAYVVRVPHEATARQLAEQLLPELRPRTARADALDVQREEYLARRTMTAYAAQLLGAVTGRA